MDLIKTPNPAFDKKLFLKSLAKQDQPVEFKITGVGNIFKSKMNGNPHFFTEMEILTDFPDCETYELDLMGKHLVTEDGTKNIVKINAKGEIIGFPYQLVPSTEVEKYTVSNKTNLFSLLNHAFITKGIVAEGNQQGFNNVTFDEIKEALLDLEFKGISILHTKTRYNPYYKLVPVK